MGQSPVKPVFHEIILQLNENVNNYWGQVSRLNKVIGLESFKCGLREIGNNNQLSIIS